MDWVTLRSRGKELVRKYRYVLLVVLAGLFLMALPDGKNTKAAPEPAAAENRSSATEHAATGYVPAGYTATGYTAAVQARRQSRGSSRFFISVVF